jgi:integrase
MEYASGIVDTPLSDEEAQRVGIPPDPHWIARVNERHLFSPAWYDDFLAKYDLEPEQRAQLRAEREAAAAFEKECQHWRPHYERAIEYPTSKIFIALRDGQLAATGRLLTLYVSGLQKLVERAGVEAGLLFKIHPHMLRHATGYALANKGGDTRTLQGHLGHRSI